MEVISNKETWEMKNLGFEEESHISITENLNSL